MDIYVFRDFRELLRHVVKEQADGWGYQSKLARAAGCQKPYFSRVLQGTAGLSHDQGYGIASFIGLSEDETEFLLLLISLDKAGSKPYAAHLNAKIEAIARSKRSFTSRLKAATPELNGPSTLYYSAWYWSAIHILVGIPGFQKEEKIAHRLQLPPALVRSVLEGLAQIGFVERTVAGWNFKQHDLHLPPDALAVLPYHQSWRQKALPYQALRRECDFFYTSIQSVAKDDIEKIRSNLAASVHALRKAVQESARDEEMVGFNCDFFVL